MTTEALTESFCERCGTRYEFAAPTELNTMRKTRGLISGLKNYIMSQDALGDAVGDAMRSEEEALASQQLEAFHESFNFCINCRQYTCLNCWNDDAGRCRTCVPVAGTDDLMEQFEASFHAQHPEIAAAATQAEMEQADLNRRLGLESWPSADLDHAPANGADPALPPAELLLSEQEPVVAEVEPEPEPTMADAAMAAAATDAVRADEYPPLRVVAWEEDAAIALEPEPIVAAEVVPDEQPEPLVAEELIAAAMVADGDEPEPGVPDPITAATMAAMLAAETHEPEPVTAEVEPEPERPAPEPIRPISETIIPMPRSSSRRRRCRMPTAWPPGRRRVSCRSQGAARPASGSAIRERERWPTARTSCHTDRAAHRSPPGRWRCVPPPGCRPPARSGRHQPKRSPAP